MLDEFSELLAAKPELIDLFVMIGRVGRSLGVHLLLASQRLEEGRLRGLDTQLSYRIGLRTFSPQESRIVLGVPDAYELPSSPGNAYLRDGTEGADPVQGGLRVRAAFGNRGGSDGGGPGRCQRRHQAKAADRRFGPGYVAPRYEETPAAELVKNDLIPSGLMGLVGLQRGRRWRAGGQPDAAGRPSCCRAGARPAHRIWLPPLSEPPALDQLLDRARPGRARGDPASACWPCWASWTGRSSSAGTSVGGPGRRGRATSAVAGGPRSGKSTVVPR